LVEARNQADSLIHSTEKSLSEAGDKVPAEDKEGVEAAIADLKAVKDQEDLEAIQSKVEALAQAAMKIGAAMYGGGDEGGEDAAPGEDASASSAGAGGEDVVDADFEEVDDDKQGKSA
jgi:molecular chaperone DnaK